MEFLRVFEEPLSSSEAGEHTYAIPDGLNIGDVHVDYAMVVFPPLSAAARNLLEHFLDSWAISDFAETSWYFSYNQLRQICGDESYPENFDEMMVFDGNNPISELHQPIYIYTGSSKVAATLPISLSCEWNKSTGAVELQTNIKAQKLMSRIVDNNPDFQRRIEVSKP